jgi:hypothetical protein
MLTTFKSVLLEKNLRPEVEGDINTKKKGRREMGLKFLAFYEWKAKDYDKIVEKMKIWLKEREKNPDKFSKQLFPGGLLAGELPSFTKDMQAFAIADVEDPQPLINAMSYWIPEMTVKLVRFVDWEKFQKASEKRKK